MTEKYKVTQGFINKLEEWRKNNAINPSSKSITAFVSYREIENLPREVGNWWVKINDPFDNNRRLIAIIQWLNGEDVFEVEK